MRISCPSCQSSYKIADEKVQGRTVKVRCRKCGLTIHVNEQGVMNEEGGVAAEPSTAGADAGGAPQFSVLVAEGDQRDMGLQEIVAAYNSGVVTADTFVWAEGQPDWMPLGDIPAVVEALNAASAAVDKAATTGETEAQQAAAAPVEQAPAMVFPPQQPAPQPMPMATAPAPEPTPAPAPLFGAHAPTPAPAAAAPAPLFGGSSTAAVQDRHSNKADLFSPQVMAGGDDDVATSAPQMAPGKPTGARDESSVLFSLSALTAASASTSGGGNGATGGDDSGLIDLRALASKDSGAEAASAMPTGGILDSAPLLGTPIVDPNLHQLKASEPPAAKKNTGMIIGIVIGAVGILTAVVAVVVVLTREPPAPPPAPVTAPVVTDTEPVIPTPPPTDTGSSAAAAPATGAPSATTPVPTKTYGGGKTGGGKTGGGKTTGTSTGGAATATTAPTKKPPANKCNCPPGDLACNMACAVK